jgi:hypothetical protein
MCCCIQSFLLLVLPFSLVCMSICGVLVDKGRLEVDALA